MKKGAFDFVTKPVKLAKLEEVISAALAAAEKEKTSLPELPGNEIAELPQIPVITGKNIVPPQSENDPMQKIYRTALAVAPSKSTVLLTGESGTGKEVVARFIHDNSKRKGLFVPVHCAALTATLLESELFGYEKGAFTGAAERRRGRFELADGGTVFLDEIGEIDAATQVKLLRVLETRSFERVGGTETLQCDLRVIAATNKDLKEMVKAGTFREDLFYRLSVINLELPPLRERRSEIPRLAQSFAAEFSAENGKNVTVSASALEKLQQKNWQGNIRELRNCIECLVVLAPDGSALEADDIPDDEEQISEVHAENINPFNLDDSEKELILRALDKCGNNRTAAAKALGISRRTLYRKLEELGIKDK
jgi:DNA-binding NtrC family response regulator